MERELSDTEQTSMDVILSGAEIPEPTPEPEKAPEPEAVEEPEKEAPEGEAKAEEPEAKPEEPEKEATVPQAALHEERKRRQDADRRYDELQTQVNKLLPHLMTPKDTEAEKPKVNFSEDPEGFVTNGFQSIERSLQQNLITMRMDMSEAGARRRHADYDQVYASFEERAKAEPALIQKLLQQPDPAEWLYQAEKHAQGVASIGNVDDYRANLEKELRAKWEAELAAREAEEPAEPVASPPKTLAKARTTASRSTGPKFAGPTPIDEILKPG